MARQSRAERDQELWERYDELSGKEQQDLRIRENLRDLGGIENMTLDQFEDAFEDRDPFEFL